MLKNGLLSGIKRETEVESEEQIGGCDKAGTCSDFIISDSCVCSPFGSGAKRNAHAERHADEG